MLLSLRWHAGRGAGAHSGDTGGADQRGWAGGGLAEGLGCREGEGQGGEGQLGETADQFSRSRFPSRPPPEGEERVGGKDAAGEGNVSCPELGRTPEAQLAGCGGAEAGPTGTTLSLKALGGFHCSHGPGAPSPGRGLRATPQPQPLCHPQVPYGGRTARPGGLKELTPLPLGCPTPSRGTRPPLGRRGSPGRGRDCQGGWEREVSGLGEVTRTAHRVPGMQ